MDAIIASMAKQAHFDAAHYTWIYVNSDKLATMDDERVDAALVAHGDYATPLRTPHIKLPFNNMAVVYAIGNGQYTVMTLDCKNSCVSQITSWSQAAIKGDAKACVVDFNPPESAQKMIQAYPPEPGVTDDIPISDDPTRNALVSVHPELPTKMKRAMIGFTVQVGRRVVRYIAGHSDGIFTDENLTFYKPTASANNAKRARKGKLPMYEWRTVELERKPADLPAAPKGGTHASPRLHQRRGHWVTSKLGKKFWRSESVVGKPENGMIFHDYTIQKGERA